jgi:serine/threonine protein kinase
MADGASADPRIGSEIAGYRIERLLGRGGMSVVYLAHHARLDRRSLDHPNVIPSYDADESDGVLFIAMRYVEGTDLRKLLADEGRARTIPMFQGAHDVLRSLAARALNRGRYGPAEYVIGTVPERHSTARAGATGSGDRP